MTSETVTVTVLLVVDGVRGAPDLARLKLDDERLYFPAAVIAEDARLPINELPGREFRARMDLAEGRRELSQFRLVNDPRI